MAKVKFSRTEENDVSSIQIVDGQLIYTKTGKCYLDYGTERIEIVTGGDTMPVGVIATFAEVDEDNSLMSDWILCDGRELSRSTYSELFSVIGTKYGQGDGSTTFNVPKIDGRSLVGLDLDDEDFNEVGKTGGSKTHTQTVEELATHNHRYGLGYGNPDPAKAFAHAEIPTGQFSEQYFIEDTGESKPMNIMNPYIVVKFYIKAFKSASSTAQVKNTKTASSNDVYSCNYINGLSNITTDGEEVKTGLVLDDKDEYVKRITIPQFPNNNALEISTGLNVNEVSITDIRCLAYRSSDSTYIPIPFISMAGTHIGLNTKVIDNILYLLIETTIDRTAFMGWATISFIYK